MGFQKAPAEQREFLYPDSEAFDQCQVSSYREVSPRFVGRYALKLEHAKSQVAAEAIQKKVHLVSLFDGSADHRFRSEHQGRYRSGVLKCGACDLGGIDHA